MPLPLMAASTLQKYMKDCMLHYIDEDDYDKAFEVPEALSEQDVIAQIKKKRKYPNHSIHKQDEIDSFINVNRIQESLLKSDKDCFLVYKWECKAMGHKSSYVFKTSAISLCIAAMMAGKIKVDDKDSPLTHEPVYFDGMHSRVKYFVSLTLWGFHLAMRSMLMLAVMDTPTKTVDDIEIFFDTFNKALADYLEEPEYIWDPYLIMMDHKGANFEALERVYGPDFWKAKTVTCQWHFLHCAEKYIMKLSKDARQMFRGWCAALMEAHTKTEYKKIAELIENFAAKQDFLPWWTWWAPRCPHLVPAIRDFNLPKVNMAEIGQSKLKQEKVLWLSQAV